MSEWEKALEPFDFNSKEKLEGNLKLKSTCQSWRFKDDELVIQPLSHPLTETGSNKHPGCSNSNKSD